MNISSALIDRINSSIDLTERKSISGNINYVKLKFESECEKLKENFVANLPTKYNDEQKLDALCGEIDTLGDKLENLKQKSYQLNNLIENYKQEKNDVKYSMIDKELRPLIEKLLSIEKSIVYTKSLIEINEISADMELKLDKKQFDSKTSLDKNTIYHQKEYHSKQLLDLYFILWEKYKSAIDSKFENLKNYLSNLVNYFYGKLTDLFTCEFDEALKSLGYPILSKDKQIPLKDSSIDSQKLLLLLYGDRIIQVEAKKIDKNPQEIHLLIKTLCKPLQKRFQYHFYGVTKKTNNLDKPEWYLTQIFQWLKDNHAFVDDIIQPIFNKNYIQLNANVEFTKALIQIINEKFHYDFNRYKESQLAHFIDELFAFNKQLQIFSNNFIDNTHVMHILCDDDRIFSQWIQLEYKLCSTKMDEIFSNTDQESIWSCKCEDIDEYKTPTCTESFILLIKAITERYKQLPQASRKLQFLQLQMELFRDYHFRLCQIMRDEKSSKDPLNETNLGILNAINYILFVLDEWKNAPFFIEMQFIKSNYIKFMDKYDSNVSKAIKSVDESNKIEALLELNLDKINQTKFNDLMKSFFTTNLDLNVLIEMNSSVFNEVSPQFELIKEDLVKKIVGECFWQVKSRSKNYRKEKWMSLPSFKSFYKPNLSQSATEMFISLKNLLNSMQESLAKNLFLSILKRVTRELDGFFYKDIILDNQFNDGGISQLEFDVNRYLIPILNEFANDFSIETYFKQTKEAILLLQLNEGSSILLREILYKGLHNSNELNENKYNAKNALKEFGLRQLSCEDAELILSLRIFKTN